MAVRRLLWNSLLFLGFLLLSACTGVAISPSRTPSTLDPQGPAAAHYAELWWVMFGLGTLIWVLVTVLMFAALLRRRKEKLVAPDSRGGDTGRNWPILGGMVLPFVVIGFVFGYTIYTLAQVDLPDTQHELKIDVVGRRWWWEVKYPDLGITTANEIHIPVGKPVQIDLHSQDVIHSFWVPAAAGEGGRHSHPHQHCYPPGG